MAGRLVELVEATAGTAFGTILEIGSGTGCLTRLVAERLKFSVLHCNDLVPDAAVYVRKIVPSASFFVGDIETVRFPDLPDLVISNATLQWIERFDSLVVRIADAMREGGTLAFTMFGSENFREIAMLTGTRLPGLTLDERIAQLETRFHCLHAEEDVSVLRFASPLDVLRHVKHTGTNALGVRRWGRKEMARFVGEYQERFGEPGEGASVTLTYHPQYFVANLPGDRSKKVTVVV
jgi:malonyl-ACP O-methyltransferase BioC